jgi:hypothetical protein
LKTIPTSLLVLVALNCGAASLAGGAGALQTVAEQSAWQQGGRYAEAVQLCHEFALRWPRQARCFEFGRSAQGRALWAIAASADGTTTAQLAAKRGRPVVLIQGSIHAGESDGKDAGLIAMREALEGRLAAGSLGRITWVFVPIFNVDGQERFGAWNRPNQIGPAEMGWRTTAQNLNLNRDYAKADTPEMRAMLGLLNDWDPVLYADLHTTDGANFEHDISITSELSLAGDRELGGLSRPLIDELMQRLTRAGLLPLSFYPSFVREDDPASGFEVSVSPPRFSDAYWNLRNRLGLLVETHSWKPNQRRIESNLATIESLLTIAAREGARWQVAMRAADARSSGLAGQVVALAFKTTEHQTMVDFRGYAYSREPSAVSGALVTHYDATTPQIWHVPLRDQVQPSIEVTAPRGGYLIPPEHAAWLRDRLAVHGIRFQTITAASGPIAIEEFRATDVAMATGSFEGHTQANAEGEWHAATDRVASGALYVPIAQPKAPLVMALLEPRAPDSFVSWGFFNLMFERREYMENYVAEQVGAKMLAGDAAVRDEFEQRLATDAKFAADPAARLDFFYQRHASWDQQYRRYPVVRVACGPEAAFRCSASR